MIQNDSLAQNRVMTKEDSRIHPYPIRLTRELREQLETIAKANGRSLNAEMLLRLEESLKNAGSENSGDFTPAQEKRLIELIRNELAKAGKG